MLKRYLLDTYGSHDEFWDRSWARSLDKPGVPNPVVVSVFQRYCRGGMYVLEGGCGNGTYYKVLREIGCRVIGVDFARKTIATLKSMYHDWELMEGDVCALPFAEDTFDAYYSGGVVEHFEDGPYRALQEAYRVLKPGGIFMVSVPYIHTAKKVLMTILADCPVYDLDAQYSRTVPCTSESVDGKSRYESMHFHEYQYTAAEFMHRIYSAGFDPLEYRRYSIEWGMRDAWMMMGLPRQTDATVGGFVARCAFKAFRIFSKIETCNRNGHSFVNTMSVFTANLILFVCKKPNGSLVQRTPR